MTELKTIDKFVLEDHDTLRKCLDKVSEFKLTDQDQAQRWYNQFLWEMSRHTVTEELTLYPTMENKLGPLGAELATHSRAHHQRLKHLLQEIDSEAFGTLAFYDKLAKFEVELLQHFREEEANDIPLIQAELSHDERLKLGKYFAKGKHLVPTHPHPSVPMRPAIFESALGMLITPIDKIRDLFRSYPDQDEVHGPSHDSDSDSDSS